MPVTHEMIADQVVFNLGNSIERHFKIQNMMSTNRHINKLSDHPVGTMKDHSYRDHLSAITQYRSDISVGRSWLELTDQAPNDVNTALRDAYSTAVEMSNDTYDATDLNAAVDDNESLLNQRASSGAKVVRLGATTSRLEKSGLNYTYLPSGVKDADITKLVTCLAVQDNAYNAALQSAARIIQPSLLDFIK